MKYKQGLILGILCCIWAANTYAEPLPANPWGNASQVAKDTTPVQNSTKQVQNRPSTEDLSGELATNPWAGNQVHRVHYTTSQNNSAGAQRRSSADETITISVQKNQPAYPIIRHTAAPAKKASSNWNLFDSNDSFDNSFTTDFTPTMPKVSPPSADDLKFDDMLPDFGKIKRDSTRKFNEVTAPIRKSAKEAKDFFEKGSGVKLNEVFK